MSKEVKFIIYGKPMGKQRPKFSRAGRQVRTYTPEKTVNYENLVKLSYPKVKKLEGGIEADIIGVFSIPKLTSKKKKEQMINGLIPYTKKCDCDNLAKSILDALNGIAYDDDSQVCKLSVLKQYGENPRVEVTLREVLTKCNTL